MAKRDIGKCLDCKKQIDLNKDHFIQILTFVNSKNTEDVFFHIDCWRNYFDERVKLKAKNQIELMQNQAIKIFDHPMIKGLLEQVKGSKMALNMLKLPLSPDRLVSKEQVKKKIQDGRKKRSQKRRKA